MRALSASELLSVWERGLAQPPVQQALLLLAAACPDVPSSALAEFSIGQRDARLLMLREGTFGPRVVSLATCPACSQCLELSFDVADIRAAPEPAALEGDLREPLQEFSVNVADYEVRFRLPNSLDVAAVAHSPRKGIFDEDVEAARSRLIERCLVRACHDNEDVSAAQLPEDVVNAVAARMAEADPQGDAQLALTCPACRHAWQATFDVASFFWSEINAWATRLLREVHDLASAYRWSEADILVMSPLRRQLYLEMTGRSS